MADTRPTPTNKITINAALTVPLTIITGIGGLLR